jgi:hypothetical protein
VATCQFLNGARRERKPFWRTFWVGGTLDSYATAQQQPQSETASGSLHSRIVAALDLNNVPWNMLLSAALGVWIMAAPATLGMSGAAANSNYIAGALIVTWSVIAFGEVARPTRLLNILMGLWLIAAPWLLAGHTGMARWNAIIVGAALIALCLRRGRIEERFGNWNRYLV